jgi:hypothetical protein
MSDPERVRRIVATFERDICDWRCAIDLSCLKEGPFRTPLVRELKAVGLEQLVDKVFYPNAAKPSDDPPRTSDLDIVEYRLEYLSDGRAWRIVCEGIELASGPVRFPDSRTT